MKKKVVIGLSGGVDSSVSAYLLKEQGYEVVGATMEVYPRKALIENIEAQNKAVEDAKSVAQVLGISHQILDFKDTFQKNVVDYFVSEYQKGRTPNPCNMCNRHVKWEALLQYAREIGAEYIATGHYARIQKLDNGRYSIQNSITATKDQTYALYNLSQEQLAHTLMPVGDYTKDEIRSIAEKIHLPVAKKQDSQDICFIPDGDYAAFIERETGKSFAIGNFVDEEGQVLGQHKGIIYYTVGQRKGLGLTAETPLFVKEIRPETNEVVICKSENLFTDSCIVRDMNYMSISGLEESMSALGKVRYSHKGAQCRLTPMADGRVACHFAEVQRAITPGQAAVFYEGDHVLCGGLIDRS